MQDNITEHIKRAKGLAIILGIVVVGCLLVGLALSYIYSDHLGAGACGLCFELNPNYTVCENVTRGEIPIFEVTVENG